MTFPTDRNLDRPPGDEESSTSAGGSRPLTSAEREAAERDHPLPERVYAPASERVPKEPVPGHRDMVEHPDSDTPERQAVAEGESEAEPPFTRVARPSPTVESEVTSTPTPTPTPYTSPVSSPAYESPWDEYQQPSMVQRAAGFGWLVLPMCAALGVWLYIRRRREENKPINRLRRQAQHTAAEIRERVPDTEELLQPAMGLAAALISTGLMIGRQVQRQRTLKRATATISDADWQKRLNALKERWNPGRLEMEKISISRHH